MGLTRKLKALSLRSEKARKAAATTRNALRNGFTSAAAQAVAHDLSKQFGRLLGSYVDPNSFTFNEARGYWAHTHQDVQRIAGHFKVAGSDEIYSFGTWDHTLSTLAKSGCHIIDTRGNRLADNDFLLEKGRRSDTDDSDEWYSGQQLEEIERRAVLTEIADALDTEGE